MNMRSHPTNDYNHKETKLLRNLVVNLPADHWPVASNLGTRLELDAAACGWWKGPPPDGAKAPRPLANPKKGPKSSQNRESEFFGLRTSW